MNKVILVLALILLSSNTFALEPEKNDYAACFQDGGIYMQSMGFEDSIKNYYELLTKIEKLKGNEVEEVKDLLIRRINANLHTLGLMIEDIRKGRVLSSHFYEYVLKEQQMISKSFEETKFWKKLKDEREMKNWKFKYKNEKMKNLMDQKIELALDTYIKYGNIFKME